MKLLILLSCKQALRRMDDYLAGEVSPREARWVRAHLAICHACSEHFAFEHAFTLALRDKLRKAQHLDHAEPHALGSAPPDLAARVAQALRQAPQEAAREDPGP